jgi:hypothetical protein
LRLIVGPSVTVLSNHHVNEHAALLRLMLRGVHTAQPLRLLRPATPCAFVKHKPLWAAQRTRALPPGCRHVCSVRLPLELNGTSATFKLSFLGAQDPEPAAGILAVEPTLRVSSSRASGALHRAPNHKVLVDPLVIRIA